MNKALWPNKTILIAEEEKINYLFLKTILDGTGAKVLWAQSGEEAVDFCRRPGRVDMVLMNLRINQMDGKEATRQIKVVDPDVAVIGHTSTPMSNDREEAYQAGCTSFLTKPFKPANFLAAMERFI